MTRRDLECSERGQHLIKAIWGFIFPVATLTKSSSLKEKVASGFPPSYGPRLPTKENVKLHVIHPSFQLPAKFLENVQLVNFEMLKEDAKFDLSAFHRNYNRKSKEGRTELAD